MDVLDMYQRVMAFDKGRKFDDSDVVTNATLRDLARDYALAYKNTAVSHIGINLYMVDMRTAAKRGGLTVPQARGTLNVLLAQAKYASKSKKSDGPAVATKPLYTGLMPNEGVYTVSFNGNTADHVTLKVRKSGRFDGKVVVSVMKHYGSFTGFAFLNVKSGNEASAFFWKNAGSVGARTKDALSTLMNADAGGRSSFLDLTHKAGLCKMCGRMLTDPESIQRGIGPVCDKNFGES